MPENQKILRTKEFLIWYFSKINWFFFKYNNSRKLQQNSWNLLFGFVDFNRSELFVLWTWAWIEYYSCLARNDSGHMVHKRLFDFGRSYFRRSQRRDPGPDSYLNYLVSLSLFQPLRIFSDILIFGRKRSSLGNVLKL